MKARDSETAGLNRRELMLAGGIAAGTLALGPEFWEALARPARPGPGPYGPLGPPDVNGFALPEGFSCKQIARGNLPVADTGYEWHLLSDGAATFKTGDGGWILVSNSEIPTPPDMATDPPLGDPDEGGASAIRFDSDGQVTDAYRILADTNSNCSGGPTPWGTWLSCEEFEGGMVWECDPTGETEAVVHPAMGVFQHEAVAVDRRTGFVYLSEDNYRGCFYRFRPKQRGDLSKGVLEVARVHDGGAVEWLEVPDPSGESGLPRKQVKGATKFRRGEGCWFDSGIVYLATTYDSKIWAYNTRRHDMRTIYDSAKIKNPALTAVDAITVHKRSGDLYVCEDTNAPDEPKLGLITSGGRRHRGKRTVSRFMTITDSNHHDSEVAGVCFNPRGDRLYFASQRVFGVGALYEVTGPFRRVPRRRSA